MRGSVSAFSGQTGYHYQNCKSWPLPFGGINNWEYLLRPFTLGMMMIMMMNLQIMQSKTFDTAVNNEHIFGEKRRRGGIQRLKVINNLAIIVILNCCIEISMYNA